FASAVCFCITMTMVSPSVASCGWPSQPATGNWQLLGRLALHAPRLVDDPFEKTPHGGRIERPFGGALDVQQNVLLPFRRVNRAAEDAFQLPDLDGVLGALVEEADDHFVDAVDGVAEAVQVVLCVNGVHKRKTSSRFREEVFVDPVAVSSAPSRERGARAPRYL